MGRVDSITSAIKRYDDKLFCKRVEGKLFIYREGYRVESYCLEGGDVLHSLRPDPHTVCALTDNWNITGRPVDWGIEPILARLRSIDLWKRDIVSDIEKQSERIEADMRSNIRTSAESFAHDFRSSFKKTFEHTNTANLDMKKRTTNQKKKEF